MLGVMQVLNRNLANNHIKMAKDEKFVKDEQCKFPFNLTNIFFNKRFQNSELTQFENFTKNSPSETCWDTLCNVYLMRKYNVNLIFC